jgi:hypothetical protein
MIRAFSPWPVAWCELKINGKTKRLKILQAKLIAQPAADMVKYSLSKVAKSIYLILNDGALELEQLQLEGKNIGTAKDYLFLEFQKIKEAIVKPVIIGTIYTKKVFICSTNDLLKDIMIQMKNAGYTHVPVYNEKHEFQ